MTDRKVAYKSMKQRFIVKKGLRFNATDAIVVAVYETHINADGVLVAPTELELPASKWESLCFYASNLRLLHFLVAAGVGLLVGFLSILVGMGLVAGIANAWFLAAVVLFLQARNP